MVHRAMGDPEPTKPTAAAMTPVDELMAKAVGW
jgi:hypothetical protein